MCDEKYQLPGSVPIYAQSSMTLTDTGGDCYGGSVTVWSCSRCGFLIYAGSVHYCPTPPAGFAAYPQSVYQQPTVVTTKPSLEALVALHRLADELARLTLDMPQEEQAGVWAAYYDLQAELTGKRTVNHEHVYGGREEGWRCACGVVRPDRDDRPHDPLRRMA